MPETLVRPAIFAQRGWYPAGDIECADTITRHAGEITPTEEAPEFPVAAIAPHAGWMYGGATTATAYRTLAGSIGADVQRVVLLCAHGPRRAPGYLSVEGAWETPLGDIEIDFEFAERLLAEAGGDLIVAPQAHGLDNSGELHAPFIKYFFPNAQLIPVMMPGDETAVTLGETIGRLLNESPGMVVGSADLTHYGPQYGYMPAGPGEAGVQWAEENDGRLLRLMAQMDARGVVYEVMDRQNSCGPGAIAGTIAAAAARGATRGVFLHHTSSYAVTPEESHVGYAAVVFG